MSAPDLLTRATHFFLLAEQASHLGSWLCGRFWEMSASPAPDPAVHLPALAAAVRKEQDSDVLRKLARYPVPVRLSPGILPWYDALVAAWEIHRASDDPWNHNPARLALVPLDGCSPPDGAERHSRLAEWLEEARQMANGAWRMPEEVSENTRTYKRLEALGALAAWRTALGVITSPETLRDWVNFWQDMRLSTDSTDSLLKGIAAKALLNLPEADLRAASIPPVPTAQLLSEMATAIPEATKKTGEGWAYDYLYLLDWQPTEGMSLPVAELTEVARTWLNVPSHISQPYCRADWEQLVRWNRMGALNICGIDLLPILVERAQTENNGFVLWEMAGWRPVGEALAGRVTESESVPLRKLEAIWQRHRQDKDWVKRASGWLGSIGLRQAGLASESPEVFLKAYLSAVAGEGEADELFVLAQWSPGPDARPDVHEKWQAVWQKLSGRSKKSIRQIASYALLRQALENENRNVLRRAALGVWRAGTKEAGEMTRLAGSFASRFHEVRAHLAAGRMPDFEAAPTPPAQRQYPRLALPPGHITDREWEIENEKLRIEN